ncbi:response regulator transcription factor [Streptomyces sp. NPDC007206]|uniref:response regulator transcription factor n=1 Tax=Streptomyces sp. NPDC007206 TaxID=3154317 RepID=UPI0033F2A142
MSVRVVIADDQEMVRTGFRMILENTPGIDVLDDVADGAEALEAVERLRPDVLLLDIRMPGMDGLEVTRRLCGPDAVEPVDGYRPRIVIVTTFDDDTYVRTALANGACGFLLKDASPALLVEGVRAAAAGDSLISPQITVRLLESMVPGGKSGQSASAPVEPLEPLTERELDVVRLVAVGRTNAEIAQELLMSMSTVKAHLAHVQTKLQVRNRVEIAAWAWENRQARR